MAEGEGVYLNNNGDVILQTPKSALVRSLREGAAMVSDVFMADGRPEEIPTDREALDQDERE